MSTNSIWLLWQVTVFKIINLILFLRFKVKLNAIMSLHQHPCLRVNHRDGAVRIVAHLKRKRRTKNKVRQRAVGSLDINTMCSSGSCKIETNYFSLSLNCCFSKKLNVILERLCRVQAWTFVAGHSLFSHTIMSVKWKFESHKSHL